ncbi:MAG: hypothetical protein MJ052_02800 [Sphaerochaetaceae bacterium]|nr:hypothetical protein [Sphaerochaetaceae bacterium]
MKTKFCILIVLSFFILAGVSCNKLTATSDLSTRENVIRYLLTADSYSPRQPAADFAVNYGLSDLLNILLLLPTDGTAQQITLYKSYLKLDKTEEAKVILSDYLSESLSIEDFASLVCNYPLSSQYVTSFFVAWSHNILPEEISSFKILAKKFVESGHAEPDDISILNSLLEVLK